MKKSLIIPLILSSLIACETSQMETNNKHEVNEVHTILTELFQSISDHNWEKLKSLTTDDMILVEHGLLWNTDSLINAMELQWKEFDVTYSFDFIKTHVDGNTAWTVYHNHGIASNDEKEIHINWIETVIFTKLNEQWKVIEAQSTRTKDPEIIPKS
jgi:ketosteroid isomerase-like protein